VLGGENERKLLAASNKQGGNVPALEYFDLNNELRSKLVQKHTNQ
jgi:hypothetical protein